MRAENGATLVEIVVALALAALALCGLFAAIFGAQSVSAASNHDAAALNAAADQLESIKATPFAQVFASWYDPNGKAFATDRVPPPADGSEPGRIRFLSEQEFAAETGIAIDIDEDGATGGATPSASYRFFPVEVAVRYAAGKGAIRTVRIVSAIYDVPER
jgi:hypothetical protein